MASTVEKNQVTNAPYAGMMDQPAHVMNAGPTIIVNVQSSSVPQQPGVVRYNVQNYAGAEEALTAFRTRYQIDGKYHNLLKHIKQFDNILVVDDSESLMGLADPDSDSNKTRWDELKTGVQIMCDLHEILGLSFSLYFCHRGHMKNVRSFSQISHMFQAAPNTSTNLVNTCAIMEKEEMLLTAPRVHKKLIHIFTDGSSADSLRAGNMDAFTNFLQHRNHKRDTFYSIILCTDDEKIDKEYRALEYRTGKTSSGIIGVDVTMDYRGEQRDIQRINPNILFTYGDYIAKTLVGSFDPQTHNIDLEEVYEVHACGCGGNSGKTN